MTHFSEVEFSRTSSLLRNWFWHRSFYYWTCVLIGGVIFFRLGNYCGFLHSLLIGIFIDLCGIFDGIFHPIFPPFGRCGNFLNLNFMDVPWLTWLSIRKFLSEFWNIFLTFLTSGFSHFSNLFSRQWILKILTILTSTESSQFFI